MKKLITTVIIILAVGLAMILVGGILQGISWQTPDFDGTAFASALNNVGYIVAMLSGVVLAGLGVAYAIKYDGKEKENKEDKENKK